jgi:hypothetical protein
MAERSGNGFPKALGALLALVFLGGAIALFQSAETVSALIYLLAGLLVVALFLGLLGSGDEVTAPPVATEDPEPTPPPQPHGIATARTEIPEEAETPED